MIFLSNVPSETAFSGQTIDLPQTPTLYSLYSPYYISKLGDLVLFFPNLRTTEIELIYLGK